MSKRIEKALDKNADERSILENGKIYKGILEVVLALTNITYLICLYFAGGVVKNIPLDITMFIINFSTFIGILKTINIGTFEGSIHKTSYYWSTFYTVNLLNIIWGVLEIIFKSHPLVSDYMFLIGAPILLIVELIQLIYINKKIK